MGVEITRRELSAADLRREAARAKDARASRRMLALAFVLDGRSRTEAAESCGIDRQTLRNWVYSYNAEGLAGLIDRPLPGRTPRLSTEQMRELAAVVEAGLGSYSLRICARRLFPRLATRWHQERCGLARHGRDVSAAKAQFNAGASTRYSYPHFSWTIPGPASAQALYHVTPAVRRKKPCPVAGAYSDIEAGYAELQA